MRTAGIFLLLMLSGCYRHHGRADPDAATTLDGGIDVPSDTSPTEVGLDTRDAVDGPTFDTPTPTPDAPTPTPVGPDEAMEFLRDWARAECEGLATCGIGLSFASLAQCVENWSAVREERTSTSLGIPYRAVESLAARGELELDRARGEACIEAVRGRCPTAAGLASGTPRIGPCADAFRRVDAADVGAACTGLIDCRQGLRCGARVRAFEDEWERSSCTPPPETCIVPPDEASLGADCTDLEGPCSPEACIDSVCRRLVDTRRTSGVGEACARFGLAVAVSRVEYELQFCRNELFCDTTGRCAEPLDEGAPCIPGGFRCSAGLQCLEGLCGATAADTAGAPCGVGIGAGYCRSRDLRCDDLTTRSCVPADGTLGSPCTTENRCADGLACNGRCVEAPLPSGASPCIRGPDCASGRCSVFGGCC